MVADSNTIELDGKALKLKFDEYPDEYDPTLFDTDPQYQAVGILLKYFGTGEGKTTSLKKISEMDVCEWSRTHLSNAIDKYFKEVEKEPKPEPHRDDTNRVTKAYTTGFENGFKMAMEILGEQDVDNVRMVA